MAEKVIDAPHRHITFTIPAEFRNFFRYDRDALNDLFSAVSDTLFYIFRNLSKSEDYIPGFIAVLHTFGRDLKWNPHIHVLLCEVLVGVHRTHFPIKYINYAALRKSFQKTVCDRLSARFGKKIRRLVSIKNSVMGFMSMHLTLTVIFKVPLYILADILDVLPLPPPELIAMMARMLLFTIPATKTTKPFPKLFLLLNLLRSSFSIFLKRTLKWLDISGSILLNLLESVIFVAHI